MNPLFDPLKNWPAPPSEVARRRALEESLRALRSTPVKKQTFSFSLFSLTSTVACLLLAGLIVWKLLPPAIPVSASLNSEMLAQLQSLFGTSLEAIVKRDETLEIETTEMPPPSLGQPVLITAKTTFGPVQVIAFSGSKFELSFGNERVRVEPLIAADGSVLLYSDQFVWSHTEKIGSLPVNLKTLQAIPLPPTT